MCTPVALFGQQEAESDVRTKLIALQHAWDQAELFADPKALDTLLDDHLIFLTMDGRLFSKADVIARAKSRHLKKAVSEGLTVLVFDDTAIVNGTHHFDEIRIGKVIAHDTRFTETWMREGSTWVCIAAQVTPILHPEAP